MESAEVVSGNPVLANAAISAVKKWKFQPFIKNGKPVNVSTKIPFDFAYGDRVKDIQPKDATETKLPQVQTSPADSLTLEAINQIKAVYSADAVTARLEGVVTVQVRISESGELEYAEPINGNPILAQSAVNAVRAWKFKTWKDRKYIPVRAWANISFDFKLPADTTGSSLGEPQNSEVSGAVVQSGEFLSTIRVAQGVTTGMCIHKVQPVYPPAAKSAHIQGTVVLRALINQEGTIDDLTVVSGPKELTDAAVGAVQQWRYRPYVLNRQPVKVDTTITVIFSLSR